MWYNTPLELSVVFVYNLSFNLFQEKENSIKAQDNFKKASLKIKHSQNKVAPLMNATFNLSKQQLPPLCKSDQQIDQPKANTEPESKQQEKDIYSMSEESPSETEYGNDSSRNPLPFSCFKKSSYGKNKYKLIGKYIDCVSFIFFFINWLFTTVGFLIALKT